MGVKALVRIAYSNQNNTNMVLDLLKKSGVWMGGLMGLKAGLWIAYSNKKRCNRVFKPGQKFTPLPSRGG